MDLSPIRLVTNKESRKPKSRINYEERNACPKFENNNNCEPYIKHNYN